MDTPLAIVVFAVVGGFLPALTARLLINRITFAVLASFASAALLYLTWYIRHSNLGLEGFVLAVPLLAALCFLLAFFCVGVVLGILRLTAGSSRAD